MSKKQPKEYGPRTKQEKLMDIICGSVIMVLMVILIIVLIVASMTDTDHSIGQKPWAVISSITLGALIVIGVIVYAILKVQFMKKRRIQETNTVTESKESKHGKDN